MAFWLAAALSLIANLVPYGRYVLYPFALLSTWAHEMGHGLTAEVLGGDFKHLELYENLGGVAWSSRPEWAGPLVAMGGLLGPAIAGGAFIVLGASKRAAPWTLAFLTFGLVLSLAVWIRPLFGFGFLAIAAIALGLGLIAFYANEMTRLVVTWFVGIQFCLGSLADFDYMFTESFMRDGQRKLSDTGAIADKWLLPYWFWGALVAALSLLILYAAFRVAMRRRDAPR